MNSFYLSPVSTGMESSTNIIILERSSYGKHVAAVKLLMDFLARAVSILINESF